MWVDSNFLTALNLTDAPDGNGSEGAQLIGPQSAQFQPFGRANQLSQQRSFALGRASPSMKCRHCLVHLD